MTRTGKPLRALRVLQRTSLLLEAERLLQEPPWYRVVGETLPATTLVRVPPVNHMKGRHSKKQQRKAQQTFMPQSIHYPEDKLRQNFFKDHPWELARPRILVEGNGKDYVGYDWSSIQQRNRPLDGESVIQRQMWLMREKGLLRKEAYDVARNEFYLLRERDEIEQRITSEEAMAVGVEFGKSYIELGLEAEQRVLVDWKAKTSSIQIEMRNRRSQSLPVFTNEDTEESSEGPANVTAS